MNRLMTKQEYEARSNQYDEVMQLPLALEYIASLESEVEQLKADNKQLMSQFETMGKALDLAIKSISDITYSCPLDTHDLCVFDEDVCKKLPVGEWATCWKKYYLKKAGE